MCGIWLRIGGKLVAHEQLLNSVKGLEKRGPEGTRVLDLGDSQWVFTRLAINGLNDDGMQPFKTEGLTWMCNGEIYNHADISTSTGVPNKSGSDCEVLGEFWKSCDPVAFARGLDGVFALALTDGIKTVVARDPYGVRPLFYGRAHTGKALYFASERKALEDFVEMSFVFPPGEIWVINNESPTEITKHTYHTIPWIKQPVGVDYFASIRSGLEAAVSKRMLTERPVACLLSGGLDSSLIAALCQKQLKAVGKRLKTYSIGMTGSSDLAFARKVADWIGSDHSEVVVSADEMFAAIPEVIRDIESYDITTVRASVGNWLVAKYIREHSDCKVVFNGDGSDEVWGSYLYFYKAPNDSQFESEVQRLLREIHLYDVLRSDRCISSHGLEPRTPFLDKQFVALALAVPTELRRPMSDQCEKWLLRMAFSRTGLLPDEVLWRRKEAFSDGVSSKEKSWFEEIKERVEAAGLGKGYAEATLPSAEASWYMSLYKKWYTKTGDMWSYWMPRWSPETSDPSARTLVL